LFFLLLKQGLPADILISILGIVAAALTTSSFLPQIYKAHRTKSMEDVSRYLMSIFGAGAALWMVYGIFKNDWIIIGANSTAATFNMILLYLRFAYRKKPTRIL